MLAARLVIMLFLATLPASWAVDQALLRDFYLTLPALDDVADSASDRAASRPQATAADVKQEPRPAPTLLRPRLEFWGIAPWAWATATGVLVIGTALSGARLTMFLTKERRAATEIRRRRQARRALQAIADCDGDSDLDSAMLWLAEWHGLPTGLDGHDLSSALQGLDASAAAAVMAWEVGRFAPAGTAERTRAAATWREFLRQWLRQHGRLSSWTAAVLPVAVVASPEESAAAWNRLVELPVEVAASHPHHLPGWFSAEVALVTAAVAVVAMLVICLYWRQWRWRRLFLAMMVLIAGMSVARLALCHRHDRNRLHRLAVVVHRTPLRPAPESSLSTGVEVAAGDVVELTAERNGWRQVRFARAIGWMPADAVVSAQTRPWQD
ncbi:MAG: hypothetical protein GX937_08845 [Lentisphaerae bacterium]|jgi:hypothetical protein|nr:hypothetical protein [Lentisphaerota bacterium]